MKNLIFANCKVHPISLQIARTISVRKILFYAIITIYYCSFALSPLISAGSPNVQEAKTGIGNKSTALQMNSRIVSKGTPDFYYATYVEDKGTKLISEQKVSNDNGRTWSKFNRQPDFYAGLPKGYQRSRVTSVRDPFTGCIITIVNSLDTPGLDPDIYEPKIAQYRYYLRYTVSNDAGKTWLFDEPVVQTGNYTLQNPFDGIFIGKNSIYLGDRGSIPIVTKKGNVLVPAIATLAGHNGELLNPGGGYSYTDVIVLIGTWTDGNKLSWKASQRVKGDPKRSTRGMIEPTLLEMKDSRILMVMRGGNGGTLDTKFQLPSYKWYSISNDGGETWSKPEPWCFEDGKTFFSPSSMSSFFKHSSGRCFWVGNMTPVNCQNDLPRWPLVIAEVNTDNLKLIRSSLLIVDTQQKEDLSKGRLDISHVTLIEDRETKEIILTYPRNTNAYKTNEGITVRFSLTK